jgi:DnaK suppressor protein
MDKKRLDYYKKKLQTRRDELARGIARTQQEGREADEDPTVDLADKAANSYTKEFLFGQTHNERALLQLVDDALARIRDESFGECVSCHQELQQKRLEAVPWTRYCISCQEKVEQGQL